MTLVRRPVPPLTPSESFEREIGRHRPAMFAAALRFLSSSDDAEDLVAYATARAFQAYPRFDGKDFRAWIVRIVENLAINEYHRRQRRQIVTLDAETEEGIQDASPLPLSLLIAGEFGEEVRAAFSEVPYIFAHPVLMIDHGGVTYEEYADSEGIPVGTVRSRLSRGREALRKLLARYAEEQGYIRRG